MTEPSERAEDAVELSERRLIEPDEQVVADAVRRAVTDPPGRPTRADLLVNAAAARARRRRRQRLTAGSALLATTAAVVAFGVAPAITPALTSTSVPATTPTPAPAGPTEEPATPLTYLTPSEVHAVFPDADSLDPGGEFQWFDVQGHEWSSACGAGSPLEGVAPLHSMQIASWGQATPQPPDPVTGEVYTLISPDVSANMHIFTDGAQAEGYAAALQDSVTTCTPQEGFAPSMPVPGLLDSGAAALFSHGYSEGAYSIIAVGVRDRYASTIYASVPAPHTDEGYVTAARAVAGLATTSAARAAETGLP